MCVCVHACSLSQNLVKYCFIVQVIAAELEISILCFDHFNVSRNDMVIKSDSSFIYHQKQKKTKKTKLVY